MNKLCLESGVRWSYEKNGYGFKFISDRVTNNGDNVTLDVTLVDLNSSEKETYLLIKSNPKITREEIATNISKNIRTVHRTFELLKKSLQSRLIFKCGKAEFLRSEHLNWKEASGNEKNPTENVWFFSPTKSSRVLVFFCFYVMLKVTKTIKGDNNMKRKALSTLLAASAAVCFTMGIASCKKKKGADVTTSVSETTSPSVESTSAALKDAKLVITSELDRTYDFTESSVTYTTESDGAVTVKWFKGEEELTSAPVTAGTYKVEVSVAATAAYKEASVSKEFTISKRALTVTLGTMEYNGNASMEITLDEDNSNIVSDDEVYLTLTLDSAAAGTHTVTDATLSGYDSDNYSYDYSAATVDIVISHTTTAELEISSIEEVPSRGTAFSGTITKGSFAAGDTVTIIDAYGNVIYSGLISSINDTSVLVSGISVADAAGAKKVIKEA